MTAGYGLNAPDHNQRDCFISAACPQLVTGEVGLSAPSGRSP